MTGRISPVGTQNCQLNITFGECAETEDVHLLDLDFFRFLRRLVDSNLEACQRKLRRTEPSPTKSAPSIGSTNGARLFLLHFMSKVTQDCRCFPQGIVCSGCFLSQGDASAELLTSMLFSPIPLAPIRQGVICLCCHSLCSMLSAPVEGQCRASVTSI